MDDQPTITQPTRRGVLQGLAGAGIAAGGVQLAQFALGSTPAHAQAQTKPIKLAVVAQQMSAQSDQRSWVGLQQWLKATGLGQSWHVDLTDAKGDPGALVSQVENAITGKSDAILVMFGTLTAAHSALADLASSKIPFFSLDSGWQSPSIADITCNNYVMGSKNAQYMVERLLSEGRQKANICAVIANFHHGTRKRGKVMRTVLSENEWISLEATRVIQYTGFFETTQNVVNDWLTRYGSDLDAIWCPWDEPGIAAAEVIKSHNLQDKIFVVSADGNPTTIERMRDPAYPLKATVAQPFELWGAYTGWMINEIVGKGRPAKQVVPVPSVEFPSPLLVSGINLPSPGTKPYDATDLYYVYRDRAVAGMKA